jgi:hypothetical protein
MVFFFPVFIVVNSTIGSDNNTWTQTVTLNGEVVSTVSRCYRYFSLSSLTGMFAPVARNCCWSLHERFVATLFLL